jgi:anti-sigma-K factor RskA
MVASRKISSAPNIRTSRQRMYNRRLTQAVVTRRKETKRYFRDSAREWRCLITSSGASVGIRVVKLSAIGAMYQGKESE